MDKRTILFVLSLTLTLFLVNIYFERQNQENLLEWSQQHKEQLSQQAKQLTSDIAKYTAKPSDLPEVNLYADHNGTQLLSSGIRIDRSIITFPWTVELPKKVYVKKSGSEQTLDEYTLQVPASTSDDPILYSVAEKDRLPISDLPDFGKFELQLFQPSEQGDLKSPIVVGNYTDGHLSVPLIELKKIEGQLNETKAEALQEPGNSIALIKTTTGYLPVGVFLKSTQKIYALRDIQAFANRLAIPEKKELVAKGEKSEEKFFVLQNDYQQLVFSNYGGALIEINLPFATKTDKASVVKEIEFDREMVEKHPYNAYFPSHAYYTPATEANGSYVEHSKGTLGGYYPLIRRDLIEAPPRKSVKVPPRLYALNVVSEYPEVAELVYEVKQFDDKTIIFEANQPHRRITKKFSIASENNTAPYCVEVTIKVDGDSRGLWLTTGVPEVEWISGGPAPSLKYRITRNDKASVENIDLPKDSATVSSFYPDWICNSNGFLGIILDPLSPIDPGFRVQYVAGNIMPSRLIEIDEDYNRFDAQQMPGYQVLIPLNAEGGTMKFRLFAGPFSESVLKTVDQTYSDPEKGYNPDYIACQTFHGWFAFISEPFAKFLFILMKFFYQLTGSWGFSIILLTVALRVMMYPLNAWSTKSMVKMQQIGPEVTAIQEKFKKEPKKAQVEIMNLYRERGVNPVSGCLPLLIQMPFLIGMFDLLKSTFELRGASFIPGWIDNLAAPDVLFSWSTPIFFIGNQFHLLPFLLGGVMFLQQKLMSTAPKDPKLLTDQQRQQKAMGTMMTVVFTVMFYNFPSGLNIYWLSSMLLGIVQQWWTTKQMKAPVKPSVVVQGVGISTKKGTKKEKI